MRDGLARVRERVAMLRGKDSAGSRDQYVLLPAGAGRRRRLAEVGAAAGIVVVVLAFVGATVALRPTSSSSPQPDGPGLPAPTEVVGSAGSPTPASSSAPAVLPDRPSEAPPRTAYRPRPTATGSGTPTTPAPTTQAPVPTRTTPPRTTPPPSPTVSPSPSPTVSPSPSPTTEPAPGVVDHPFG